MKRRALLRFAWVATAVAAGQAQAQGRVLVGVLTPAREQWREAAFRERLRELGHVEGVNLELDIRSADARLDRVTTLGQQLVQRNPAVIVGVNTPGTRGALAATRTIPIVMAMVGDPVGLGFVASLARPEGNVTGISNAIGELAAKRLGLLLEVVPRATRIAALFHPDEPIVDAQRRALEAIAQGRGLAFRWLPVRTVEDLVQAFDAAVAGRADALLRLAGQAITLGPQTAALALARGLPSMLLTARDVDAGGLMSYYVDEDASYRRVAEYVDRILRGSAPSDLPVELPTRYELVLNERTARALGLRLPPTLLLQAARVVR